jgi:hypothetical protein
VSLCDKNKDPYLATEIMQILPTLCHAAQTRSAKGGTEADGTKSTMYCSYCYKDGRFTDGFTTAKAMQDFCKAKLVAMKFPRMIAWLFTRNIPKLERWKGQGCEERTMRVLDSEPEQRENLP